MAIIKTLRNATAVAAMFEDPQPGSDYIYIQTDAYSKSTLNPYFDKGLQYSTSGKLSSGDWYGFSNPNSQSPSIPDTYLYGRLGGILQLAGETTHVRHNPLFYGVLSGTTLTDGTLSWTNAPAYGTLDLAPFVSLDPANKCTPVKYFSDGANNLVLSAFPHISHNAPGSTDDSYSYTYIAGKLNTSPEDLATSNTFNYLTAGNGSTVGWANLITTYTRNGTISYPLYRNPGTGNLVWQTTGFYSPASTDATKHHPSAYHGTSWTNMFSASPTRRVATGLNTVSVVPWYGTPSTGGGYNPNAIGFFLGASSKDGNAISVHVPMYYDHPVEFYKYNDQTNTVSVLNNYFHMPMPAGLGGTGVAGTGTYIISNSMSLANTQTAITGTLTGNNGSWVGRIEGNVMTVTGSLTGAGVVPFQVISGTGITVGTTVTAYTTSSGVINGERGTSFGHYHTKAPSKIFTDTSYTSVLPNWGFFIPRFDSGGNYQPMYFIWNKNTDYITRYSDILVTYPGATTLSSYWAFDTAGPFGGDTANGLVRITFNETFFSNGNRYLLLGKLHGAGLTYDQNILQRTWIVYQLDSTNYKKLTYHSKIEIGQTPKNICWLNDARTLLSIICHNATYIYYFNSSTGFQLTATFPYQFSAIGRDALGKVWAHDIGTGFGRLHLLTGVPATVSVTSANSTYNYAGTTIPTTFSVDAYDLTGSRMTATVVLSVVGTSLQLSALGSVFTSSITTTTNTLASTTVFGNVISNGYSSITTTLTI